MLQDVQQAATGLCSFSIDETDDGVLQITLVDFTEGRHLVRLGIVQELEQHLPVNGKEAIITRRFTDHITIILREPFHYEMLVFFFAQNIIHALGTSFLPVTYSKMRDLLYSSTTSS